MDEFVFVKNLLEMMSTEQVHEATAQMDDLIIQKCSAPACEIILNIIFSNESIILRKQALFYLQYICRMHWCEIDPNIRNFIKQAYIERVQQNTSTDIMKDIPEFTKCLINCAFCNESWPEFYQIVNGFLSTQELLEKGLIFCRSYVSVDLNEEFLSIILNFLFSVNCERNTVTTLAIDLYTDLVEKNVDPVLEKIAEYYEFVKSKLSTLTSTEMLCVLRFFVAYTSKQPQNSAEIAEFVFNQIYSGEWPKFTPEYKCKLLNIYSNLLDVPDLVPHILNFGDFIVNIAFTEFNVTPEMFEDDPANFVNSVDEIGDPFETPKLAVETIIKKVTFSLIPIEDTKSLYSSLWETLSLPDESFNLFKVLHILSFLPQAAVDTEFYFTVFENFAQDADFIVRASVYMFFSQPAKIEVPAEYAMQMYQAMVGDESRLVQYYAAVCCSKYLFETEQFKNSLDFENFVSLFNLLTEFGQQFGNQDILSSLYYMVESCNMNPQIPCNIIEVAHQFLDTIDINNFSANESLPLFSLKTIIKVSAKFEGEEDIERMHDLARKLLILASGFANNDPVTSDLLFEALADIIYYVKYSNIFWDMIDEILEAGNNEETYGCVSKVLETMIFKDENFANNENREKIYSFITSLMNESTLQELAPVITAFIIRVPGSFNAAEIASVILSNEIEVNANFVKALSQQIENEELRNALMESSMTGAGCDEEDFDENRCKWF